MSLTLPRNSRFGRGGFIFVEAVMVVSFTVVVFVTVLSMGFMAVNLATNMRRQAQMQFLAQEEMEAIRAYGDGTSWSTGIGGLATGVSKYMAVSSGVWQVVSGSESVSGATRGFVVEAVSRDPSTGLVEVSYNASHDDSDTRKITATVVDNGRSYVLVEYVTHWK